MQDGTPRKKVVATSPGSRLVLLLLVRASFSPVMFSSAMSAGRERERGFVVAGQCLELSLEVLDRLKATLVNKAKSDDALQVEVMT